MLKKAQRKEKTKSYHYSDKKRSKSKKIQYSFKNSRNSSLNNSQSSKCGSSKRKLATTNKSHHSPSIRYSTSKQKTFQSFADELYFNKNKHKKKAACLIPSPYPIYPNQQRKAQKLGCTYNFDNKENYTQNKYILNNTYTLNKDLLSTSNKPNKIYFMNRVSHVYDLVLSKIMLPQFVQYFLGQALFIINKGSRFSPHSSGYSQQKPYDWKLDEFKKICQHIYENSTEEDLKFFMGLSLPQINRWGSKMNSTKNSFVSRSSFNGLKTTQQESRVTNVGLGLSRVDYFKSLNRKQRNIDRKEGQTDKLQQLHNKLDKYISQNYNYNKLRTNVVQAQKAEKHSTIFSKIFRSNQYI